MTIAISFLGGMAIGVTVMSIMSAGAYGKGFDDAMELVKNE
jgi:hypothetical protein